MEKTRENKDKLIIKEYPAKPSFLIYTVPFFLTLAAYVPLPHVTFSKVLVSFIIFSLIIYSPLYIYFLYRKKYPLTITLDRNENILTISHITILNPDTIKLPIRNINRIIFKPSGAFGGYLIIDSCKLTFIMENNETFNMTGNIFYFEAYERIAKKISDYLQIDLKDNYF